MHSRAVFGSIRLQKQEVVMMELSTTSRLFQTTDKLLDGNWSHILCHSLLSGRTNQGCRWSNLPGPLSIVWQQAVAHVKQRGRSDQECSTSEPSIGPSSFFVPILWAILIRTSRLCRIACLKSSIPISPYIASISAIILHSAAVNAACLSLKFRLALSSSSGS